MQLLNEIYLIIDGRMAYLWRAVDVEGEVLDVLGPGHSFFLNLIL
jgi:transposase-like protein